MGKEGKVSPVEQQSGVHDIRDSVLLQEMDLEASEFVMIENDLVITFAYKSMKYLEH